MPSGDIDYATALDNLADLTQARGKLRSASRLEKKVLHLFLQNEDHVGAAWTYSHLAVIELTRKHSQNAERYLQRASEEARLGPQPGGDYDAAFYSARAWLSELEGNPLTAVSEYQRSVALQFCKDCLLTGWTCVLLGKAYSETGRLALALETMRHGLSILSSTDGQHTPRYVAAEGAYAQLLDESGGHSQADVLEMSIRGELSKLHDGLRGVSAASFAVAHQSYLLTFNR
jgi:tetratricopeptide (TPR) repeat protein